MAGNTFFFNWEVDIASGLQKLFGPDGISLVSHFSLLGEEIFIVLLLGLLYWSYDKRIGRRVCENLLMINVWGPMIKNVFLRRRPYFDHETIQNYRTVDKNADPLDIQAQGYSFPSGHSANSAGLCYSLAMLLKKKWIAILGVIIPLLVGFSRVAVGVHYITDVLGGWTLGILTVVVLNALTKVVKKRWVLYGVLTLTALPGLFYCKSTDYFTGLGMLLGFFGAVLFEERFVNFENTRKPLWFILRIVCGFAIFGALNSLLKMPFSKEFLNSGSTASLYVRLLRYAVVIFIDFGIYPMFFKLVERTKE